MSSYHKQSLTNMRFVTSFDGHFANVGVGYDEAFI